MVSAVTDVAAKLEAHAIAFVREHRLPGASVESCTAIGWHGRRASASATLPRGAHRTRAPFTAWPRSRRPSPARPSCSCATRGCLGLDDPAVAHLPELAAAASPFGPIESVTIRRLLSHESGLMGDPPGTDWDGPRYEGMVAVNLANARPDRHPCAAEHPAEVLEHGLPVARRDGGPCFRPSPTPTTSGRRSWIRWGWHRTGFLPLPDSLEAAPGRRLCATAISATTCGSRCRPPTARPRAACCRAWTTSHAGCRFSCARTAAPEPASQVLAGTDAGRDAPPALPGGRRAWGLAWGDQLVRHAQGRGGVGAALRRAARVPHRTSASTPKHGVARSRW